MQSFPANPDYHFLVFAPGLDNWIFRAARRYWAAYRPILYGMRTPEDFALVGYAAAEGRVVVVTLAMRRDTAAAIRAAAEARLTAVTLDPLVYDTPTDLQITLDARVEFNQRFGVPQTPVDPGIQPTRTPGPIPLG